MNSHNGPRRLSRRLVPILASAFFVPASWGATPLRTAHLSPLAPVTGERPLSPKLDPALRRLVRDAERRAPLAWALPSGERMPLIRTETLDGGDLAAAVLVRSTDPARTRAEIGARGGYVRVEAGDIVVGVLPVAALEALADLPESVSVEASYLRKPLLDVSRPATRADLVQSGTGLPSPRTGSGVIVGVVDTGISYQHADFNTASGTRLRSIWDISGVASGGSTPRICSPADINSGTCAERDLNGHGTHVAGTAAGNGRAQGGFVGMAPEAEIVFAKGTRSTTASGGFADDDVVAACTYIFQQAQAAGKPAVINLSLGAVWGPLDGTSTYEQALSNLTGAGRIIVAAAGNNGSDLLHLSYAVEGTDYATALETNLDTASDNSEGDVLLWYGSGAITVGIAARTGPDDTTGIVASAGIAPGQSTGGVQNLVDGSGNVLAKYEIDATATSYSTNGAHLVYVSIQPVASRYFSLYTWGSGTFDAYAYNLQFDSKSGSYWRPGDTTHTIGSPATSRKVVSAGAYTTKKSWVDVNGTTQTFTSWCGAGNEAIGDIACFSSRGPTRDGRVKPDLAAPGHRIAAALSADSIPNHDPTERVQGGKLLMESGTSMASPHVTGIVALMLQASPALTYEQVLQTLQSTAAKDGYTGSATNNTWGAGKIDAYAAVASLGQGCTLACTASVPSSANAGQPVSFSAGSTASGCSGSPAYTWDFGDGQGSTSRNPSHTYQSAAVFNWSLSVSQGGATCAKSGSIAIGGGQPAAATWILPSSAHASGSGAFWTTDLVVSNTGATAATVTLRFLGNNQPGTSGPTTVYSIPAGRSRILNDVLFSEFGVGSGWGGLQLSSTSASLAVLSQTWTPAPAPALGSYGQSVPAFPSSWLIGAAPRSITGLREQNVTSPRARFRTNLVLTNASESPITVQAALYDENGSPLGGAKSYPVPALGTVQESRVIRDFVPSGDVTFARIVLSTPTPGGSFAAYAAVIDEDTADPRTLLPQ